jgi:hypothetical protein
MRQSLLAVLLGLFLFWSPSAVAQDPEPTATEEAAPEADAPAADAPEAEAPAADAPEVEADKPAADAEKPSEGDEAAAEGEDKGEDPKAPGTDEEAVATAMLLVDAIKAGQWPMAVGLFLTLLVYLVNRFALKGKVDEKVIPWVAFGVGVAGAAGTGLVIGTPIVEALTEGVVAGVAAVGGWEMALKHVTAKKDEAPVETPTETPADKPTDTSA